MIIDAHAHCGKWFFPIFCESPRQVARLCDRYGIEKAVFSSSRAITYDMESGNLEVSQFIRTDSRFYAYVYLNPGEYDRSRREMEKYLSMPRFVGVKMHPSYSGEPANSKATFKLLDTLPESKVVLVHTWGRDGVNQVCELATALPAHHIIMGHMGGGAETEWRAGIEGALRCPNTYLEICGSVLHLDRIREAVGAVGSDRIVFGSDMTLLSPAFALGQVLDSDIGEEDKRRILHDNAARLFRFEG